MRDDLEKTDFRRLENLLPAQEETAQAFLVCLSGSEVGRMFRLEPGATCIGRSRVMDCVINDDGVSRAHAEVTLAADGSVTISDCASTNGTLLNGVRLNESQQLRDGDRIQLGVSVILKLSYQDHLEESFQKQLYNAAVRDALTGLYNKRFFGERLEQEFSYALRHDVPYSILLIDVDHFKRVNDSDGHAVGDLVLKQIARTMTGLLRSEELLARCGGEEFAILMLGSDLEEALAGAERVRARIEACIYEARSDADAVTVSIGVACTSSESIPTSVALLKRADEYLYQAKRSGRNRVCGPNFPPSLSAAG